MGRAAVSASELGHYRKHVRKAIRADGVVCLECGGRWKSLGHHLRTHGITVRAYRDKWRYPDHAPLILHRLPNVDPPKIIRRVLARELARCREHLREAVRADGFVCLECGKIFRRLAAHLIKHHLTIDDYRERWGYRRGNPLLAADLVERKRQWALAKNLVALTPPDALGKAHAALRRGHPPVRLETRLNQSERAKALPGGGWRQHNLKVPAETLRALVQEGLTQKEISQRTGLRPSNVWRRLNALGLRAAPRRPRPPLDAKDAELLALREAGLWNQEVARRTGMKPEAVSARFERMRARGVAVPTPARPVPTPRQRASDETLLALVEEGLPIREIAARVGLVPSSVSYRLRAMRRRGRMHPALQPPPWKARDEAILALRQEGLWASEIAARTGLTKGLVSKRLVKLRRREVALPPPTNPRPSPLRRVTDNQLLALVTEGLRPPEIAARVGLHRSTVKRRLRALRRRGGLRRRAGRSRPAGRRRASRR